MSQPLNRRMMMYTLLLKRYKATYHQDREPVALLPRYVEAENIELAADCFFADEYGYLLKRVEPCPIER